MISWSRIFLFYEGYKTKDYIIYNLTMLCMEYK